MIFQETDYRVALKKLMISRKKTYGLRYTFDGMAKAAGIQKSYLSRIIAGKGHFSEDQLFLAVSYLQLDEAQMDYFILLMNSQRTSCSERLKSLERKLETCRQKFNRTERHLNVHTEENLARFYSHPFAELVHAGLTIDRYKKQPELLRRVLGMTKGIWEETLAILIQLNIIHNHEGKLSVEVLNHHLPEDHPVRRSHTLKKRIDSLRAYSEGRDPQEYRFSAVFSASKKTRERVKEKLWTALAEIHELVVSSEAEEVFQLDLDLFSWTLIDEK